MYWEAYAAWLAKQDPTADLRRYPIEDLQVLAQEAPPTYAEAARLADVIVRGTISRVDFRPKPDMLVNVEVDEILKGAPKGPLKIVSPCNLVPRPDGGIQSIACPEAVPMLYPGDKVVLLLLANDHEPSFGIQPWTGTYWVEGDTVRAAHGNPFGAVVETMTSQMLVELLRP